MDELIEMLRRLAEWPDEADPVTIGAIAGEAAAALKAAREDARRLDWIQEHGCAVRKRRDAKRNALVWSGNFETIREAIDAARKEPRND